MPKGKLLAVLQGVPTRSWPASWVLLQGVLLAVLVLQSVPTRCPHGSASVLSWLEEEERHGRPWSLAGNGGGGGLGAGRT